MSFDIRKYIPFLGKTKRTSISLQAIDGHEEYRIPLSVINISYSFLSWEELNSSTIIQLISEELKVNSTIVKEDIENILKGMRTDLICCIEYPYIEEYYRDCYYSYYSRKHNIINRNCFRISFFDSSVTESNFYSSDLSDKFYGYIVCRPTPRRIIGYTFLSPQIYKENNFSICICKRDVSIMGRILEVSGFPFCGQDGEMNTCAENAIVIMFDYFSRRYNKYSRVLPSQIASLMSDSVLNRKQPSVGLDMDTVASIIETRGMATRRYIRQDENKSVSYGIKPEKFLQILHIYIESGIPIYASSSSHVFLIIGRENLYLENGAKIVCMNDNEYPYSFMESMDSIDEFIVPISENILLNADDLDFDECIKNIGKLFPKTEFLREGIEYFHRIYMTTSRSYKAYIANSELSKENKDLAVSIAMPKFVWVCEFISKGLIENSLDSTYIDLAVVLDATDSSLGYNHLLMLKSREKMVIPCTDKTRFQRKQYSIIDSNESMLPFARNLKSKHTQWK